MIPKRKDPLVGDTIRNLLLKMDTWSRRKYQQLLSRSEDLQVTSERGEAQSSGFKRFMSDIFGACYEMEPRKMDPVPGEGRKWENTLDSMMNLKEYQDLHAFTQGRPAEAALAANVLGEKLIEDEKLPKDRKQPTEEEQALLRQSLRRACKKAEQEVVEARAAAATLSFGNEAPSRGEESAELLLEIHQAIKANPQMKKIADMAGRFKRYAQKRIAEKTRHGVDTVKTVGPSQDLIRLLPTEIVRMQDPLQETQFIADLYEGKTLGYQLEGKEFRGKGPIVLCCDESGSMSGAKHLWAKAVAMSLLTYCLEERRSFVFIHFSTVVESDVFPASDNHAAEDVLKMLTRFLGGGTSFDPPMSEALDYLEVSQFDKGDLIFITDGAACNSDKVLERFRQVKAEKQFVAFGIGVLANPSSGVFKEFDKTFHIRSLNPEDTSELFTQMEAEEEED